MTTTQSIQEFGSFQEMSLAAAEAAAVSFGRPISGVLYTQGGRRFISTGLPVRMLLSLARTDSATKKGNPAEVRNRPLDNGHVREIINYLTTEEKYLVPPIMLNASQRLQVFAYRTPSETKPCVFVLPHDEYLYVTDGQHRLEALRQSVEARSDLGDDSVGVTIIEESDLDKVHQDFFDAAQVKPLAKALLVEYDGREPMNWLAKEVSTESPIFHGRIERIGSVGKNSLMLFTNNQVKLGVWQLIVGDWSIYSSARLKQAGQTVAPAKGLWLKKILAFFEAFTTANRQWNAVAQRPLESGLTTDIPAFRDNYIHFTGGGLLVLCGVGHTILDLDPMSEGTLSDAQTQHIQRLAELDWSRTSPLWAGGLVSPQGSITPHKGHVVLAVARAKSEVGLSLSQREQDAINKAEAIAAKPEQQPALAS